MVLRSSSALSLHECVVTQQAQIDTRLDVIGIDLYGSVELCGRFAWTANKCQRVTQIVRCAGVAGCFVDDV